MNCGSIAIALSAEYGDDSPGGISLMGRSCRIRCPPASSQRAIASMSPISPTPQLRDEGIENSGINTPARRDPDPCRVIRPTHVRCKRNAAGPGVVPSRAREPQQTHRRLAKDVGPRQEADYDKSL